MTGSTRAWSRISKAATWSLFIVLQGTTTFSEKLTPERLWELGRLSGPADISRRTVGGLRSIVLRHREESGRS